MHDSQENMARIIGQAEVTLGLPVLPTLRVDNPEGASMGHSDYRTLLDRGRKAGLGTSELYQALAARPAANSDPPTGQCDSNGYVSQFDQNGHRVFVPNVPKQ